MTTQTSKCELVNYIVVFSNQGGVTVFGLMVMTLGAAVVTVIIVFILDYIFLESTLPLYNNANIQGMWNIRETANMQIIIFT